MDKLVIAVCCLGLVVVFSFWVLSEWGHPGRESTQDTKSHRRLMEEIRRHGQSEEGR